MTLYSPSGENVASESEGMWKITHTCDSEDPGGGGVYCNWLPRLEAYVTAGSATGTRPP